MNGRRTRKTQIMTLSILVVAVFVISVGFAAFSSTLTIQSNVAVNPDSGSFNVVFSNDGTSTATTQTVNVKSGSGDPATIDNTGNPKISGLKAKFANPGESVTYEFYALNKGAYLAYLNYITYGFATGSTKTVACKVAEGSTATPSLVESACEGISLSVQVGNDAAVTDTTTVGTGHTLSPSMAEKIIITISYASDATRVDGAFDIAFGDVTLTYSTIQDYVIPEDPICTAVTSDTKTTGNIPGGNFAAGDEYICDVNGSDSYHFFVLGTTGDNVNLMLEANVNSNGKAIKSDSLAEAGVKWTDVSTTANGPTTALAYLNQATATNWTNIPTISPSTYTDQNPAVFLMDGSGSEGAYSGYGTITLSGNTRLPSYSEISAFCGDYADANCPLWMRNYMSSGSDYFSTAGFVPVESVSQGYWLMDTTSYESNQAMQFYGAGVYPTGLTTTLNVRPVISIPSTQLK